jgi:hypothetical protein
MTFVTVGGAYLCFVLTTRLDDHGDHRYGENSYSRYPLYTLMRGVDHDIMNEYLDGKLLNKNLLRDYCQVQQHNKRSRKLAKPQARDKKISASLSNDL